MSPRDFRISIRVALSCLVTATCVQYAGAQTPTVAAVPYVLVSGTVKDAAQRAAPNATTTLTVGGSKVSTKTDSNGDFVIAVPSTLEGQTATLATKSASGVSTSSGLLQINPDTSTAKTIIVKPQQSVSAQYYIYRRFYFVTDRVPLASGGYGIDPDTTVHYGSYVSHVGVGQSGCVELLAWACAGDVRAEPDTYVDQVATTPSNPDQIYAAYDAAARASKSHVILVFVHGFNQTLGQGQDALGRVAFELGLDDAEAIAYSWPSRGSIKRYTADAGTATSATVINHFEDFLGRLAALPSKPRIVLVVHSMGNRLVMRALEDLNGLNTIAAVAFAAPDVQATDLATVAQHVAPSIRLRVYYSHNDLALRLSQCINQDTRLGEGVATLPPPGPPTLSSYDASNVATRDGFGHGYFANTEPVAEDLNQFFGLGNPIVMPALRQVHWLGQRDNPTLDLQEALMEGSLACSVAGGIVI